MWNEEPVEPHALAAWAHAAPVALEAPLGEFSNALESYLAARLLCKDCRLNVLKAWRQLQESSRRRAACGCTAAFCSALLETGQQWWPDATFSLTATRLQADWPAAFKPSDRVSHFEFSLGCEAGQDDLLAWQPTPHGGPFIDAQVCLNESEAAFLNLRAHFSDGRGCQSVSARAQPMLGEECCHRRFSLVGGTCPTVSLSHPPGEQGLLAFFQHAQMLQDEDAAESAAEADAEFVVAAEDSHVDTPELAAEALLEAACVILKQRAEREHRRQQACERARRLAALAAADCAESVLRAAFKEVLAERNAQRLLAELEGEAAAAVARSAAASASASKKSAKKKARAAAASQPAALTPAAQAAPAVPPPPPPPSPPPPPPRGASPEPVAVHTPPASDAVKAVAWAAPASPVAPAPSQSEDDEWSVAGRRRRRASMSSRGSRDSLLSAGDVEGGTAFPALSPPQPVPRAVPLPLPRKQLPSPGTPPAAAPKRLGGPTSAPPPAAAAAAAPAPPPPPPPPVVYGFSLFAPPTPPHAPAVRRVSGSSAAFYESSSSFGLFQLPIGTEEGYSTMW